MCLLCWICNEAGKDRIGFGHFFSAVSMTILMTERDVSQAPWVWYVMEISTLLSIFLWTWHTFELLASLLPCTFNSALKGKYYHQMGNIKSEKTWVTQVSLTSLALKSVEDLTSALVTTWMMALLFILVESDNPISLFLFPFTWKLTLINNKTKRVVQQKFLLSCAISTVAPGCLSIYFLCWWLAQEWDHFLCLALAGCHDEPTPNVCFKDQFNSLKTNALDVCVHVLWRKLCRQRSALHFKPTN